MQIRGDDVSQTLRPLRRRREFWAVVALLLIALALRVYQYDWDQGHLYHPDERFILMSTAAISLSWPPNFAQSLTPNSSLIPQNFSYSYGTFSFYLLRLAAAALVGLGQIFPFLHAFDALNDLGNLRLVGRPISALFDTATVYLIYRLGRQLYGRRVAFLGAAFVAFSVIDIQLSHFYATDTIMTCLVVATIVASVEFLRRGKTGSAIWAGVFAGLALATKASAAPVLLPLALAFIFRTFTIDDRERGWRFQAPSTEVFGRAVETVVMSAVAMVIAFAIAEPFAFIDFQHYLNGITEQSSMVRGIADLPYTRQYYGRPPYLYFLQNLALFGVGIPLGLAMIAGWLYVIVRNVRFPHRAQLVVVTYVVVYFAITGDFWAKFLRYMLPISPFLALFAAVGLIRLWDHCQGWRLTTQLTDNRFIPPSPGRLRLPLELVNESLLGAIDEAELFAFDGDAEVELSTPDQAATGSNGPNDTFADQAISPRSANVIEVGSWAASPAAEPLGDLEPEARRWLELKGLSVTDWFATDALEPGGNGTVEAGIVADVEVVQNDLLSAAVDDLDPETRRRLELKGLAFDAWLVDQEPVPADERAAVAVAVHSANNGHRVDWMARPNQSADEWVEVDWLDDENVADGPRPEPLPGWLQQNPRLAAWAQSSWPSRIVGAVTWIVLAFTAFYGVAYDHMYDTPTTPVVASEWLYQNAPRGSVLATEHWEEGMPVPLNGPSGFDSAESHNFQNVTMPMYDDDNAAKLVTIVNNLEVADYIVFFSNRLYGTVPRIPSRYPMSQRYYQELFGEKLGFTLVEAATRYPNLFGVAFVDDTFSDPGLPTPALLQNGRPAPITINLGHADESFSVYDHQKVLVFKKTKQLTPDQLRALIGPPPGPNVVNQSTQTPPYKSLLLTSAQQAAVTAGGTFRDIFDRGDFFNRYPLLVWIVLTVLVGFAGLPLGFLTFRFLPDRGYLVAKSLGVLVLAWLSWMIVSLGIVQATRPATLLIFGLFLALGAIAGYVQRQEIVDFVRAHRRLILIEEGVFWLAFAYDVWIRSLNPDLWHPTLGGEKPMDLAYLTAAAKSPIYPPYDPWFSGGYMNYYYFGQVTVGTLTRISGIVPTTAYNLIVPLLFALTVGGAFTAALALIHRNGRPPGRDAIGGGILAALMVCVLGNIGGFYQLAGELSQLSSIHLEDRLPGVGQIVSLLDGTANVLLGVRQLPIPQDWYWSSTRMLALLNIPNGTGSINEFPYFTFLFADLHAHLIDLPFTLLIVALCVNIVKSGGLLAHRAELRLTSSGSGSDAAGVLGIGTTSLTIVTIASVGFAGLTAGALYPINSWDYPTYLGLLGLSLAIPWYMSARPTGRGLLTVVLQFGIIVLLSQALYRPFYAYFQSFYSGVHPSDEKSQLSWYFAINGLFLVVMVSYFLFEGWTYYRRSGSLRAFRLYLTKWDLLPRTLQLRQLLVKRQSESEVLGWYVLAVLLAIVAVTFVAHMALTGVLLILLVAALAIGLRRDRSPEDCFIVLLFATGLAISIGTEQLTIDGDIGRMNTIFKFYEQIWVLFGVAGAVAIYRMKDRLLALRNGSVRYGWIAVLAAFFLMAAIYPVFGTISRVSQRFDANIPPTLDGMAFMDHATYTDSDPSTGQTATLDLGTDKAAILWMQQHVDGTPTILEANRPIYRWGSRFSIYTGLPTVIGWDWHQKQQRWGYQYQVDERLAAVQQMYTNPSAEQTIEMLRSYNVKYIIDGELEQGFYPGARAKFDSMTGTDLTLVYNQDGVRIYQVK